MEENGKKNAPGRKSGANGEGPFFFIHQSEPDAAAAVPLV